MGIADRYRLGHLGAMLSLLLLVACGPATTGQPGTPPVPGTELPSRTREVAPRPPTPTDRSGYVPHTPVPVPTSSRAPAPSAAPTLPLSLQAEIAAVLDEYNRVRQEAEQTLDPGLLKQVCVDPYLSWKMERIQENAREGSHWETTAAASTIISFSLPISGVVHVRASKTETKLFFPRGSTVPDDELCRGPVHSYRDCAYGVAYAMVQREGRWYVSEATALGDCPTSCREGLPLFPEQSVEPGGYPALPADLYFLRDGRLWRWPAAGGALEEQPRAEGAGQVQDYRLTADGRYLAYVTTAGNLHVLDRASGAHVPLAGQAVGVPARDYRLLADGQRLLYVTPQGRLAIVDLVADGAGVFPPAASAAVTVRTYALTADERFLVYVTPAEELYVVDLSLREPLRIPTTGPVGQFALTPDGRTLVYLARLSEAEVYSATLVAVGVQTPAQPSILGTCGTRQVPDGPAVGCQGFSLSPDGRQVVFTDGEGVWVSAIPEGGPRLLQKVRYPDEEGGSFCGICQVTGWMPEGQGVLVRICCYEGGGMAVLDVGTGLLLPQDETALGWCYIDCWSEWAWASTGVWISQAPGYLELVRLTAAGSLQRTLVLPASYPSEGVGALWATDLRPLAGGRLGFAHQRCMSAAAGQAEPALYLVEADGQVRWVAPLPRFPCSQHVFAEQEIYRGVVSWIADGSAFLYLDQDARPLLLGRSDGTALWDVRELLRGAANFRWGPAVQP